MKLYSVLLVDDEEDVFQAMIKKINWEEIGFRVAGYAGNGEEALEMAEELLPDVVMTDIKMPYMDGLTLCRKLKEKYGNIKVIIFSGFDEFEYAKEAIKIEAEEYILKPINAAELTEVYERVRDNLDRELDEKRNIDKLREYYLKSLPIMQEQFVISLIEGSILEDQMDAYIANYQIELEAPYYAAAVVHADMPETTDEKQAFTADPVLMMVSLKNLLDENLRKEWKFRSINYLGDIIVIVLLEKASDIKKCIDYLDKICKMAKRIQEVHVTAGIGQVCSRLTDLKMSYEGAKNALDYRVMYESSQAIHIEEIDPGAGTDYLMGEQGVQQIVREIKLGETAGLQTTVAEFIKSLKDNTISLQQYRILLMEMITQLYKLGNSYQLNMDNVFEGEQDVYQKVLQAESLESLGQWLLETCTRIRSGVRKERTDTTKLLIEKAVQYVEEKYADSELSVESVCGHLNVSSAYFSTIFKKETGKTFVNYLTHLRMERAVELLNTTEDKTYIIAEKVGYSEPNYFSYVFKKQYGISPSKYRMSVEGNGRKN